MADTIVAMEKAQAFAHRLVEFADFDACVKFFNERQIDFDRPNDMGWSVLMSVCASGRDDLVGVVVDRTGAVDCATTTNRTTVLHLTAMSKNTRVMEELVATAERKQKLRKVLDQPNANGDTALMMACVAKNLMAVQLLLELGANMSAVNASGLNALMCAARVGEDPRPGAPSIEEMMKRSAAIVKILLAHGADVNVVEKAGGNTALHLAVLSENPNAVESLITNAPDFDITLRNEADNTALDLCKRISGVASAQMEDLLSPKWTQHEKVAAQMSAKVEQELMELVVKEAVDSSERKQTTSKSGKKKKMKKQAKVSKVSSTGTSPTAKVTSDHIAEIIAGEKVEPISPPSPKAEAGQQATPDQRASEIHERSFENDEGNWQSVLPRKSRRKESVSENEKTPTIQNPRKAHGKPSTKNKSSKKKLQVPFKPSTAVPKNTQEGGSSPMESVATTSVEAKAPWAIQPTSRPTKPSICASPRSQVIPEEDEDQFVISYEQLNGSFKRTFPVAAELEIGVEKFLIASSVSDRELEPNDSLSISQVEALQEAHWQAYHYLNEKKIELTRVLEAQRVEAQFALQQELMQMK